MLIYVHRKVRIHGKHSGYQKILEYFDGTILEGKSSTKTSDCFFREYVSELNTNAWYDISAFNLELETIKHMLNHGGNLYHILYAESSFQFTGFFSKLHNNKIITTFHQPPSLLHKIYRIKNILETLDAAIALSRNTAKYLTTILGEKKVFFIPHGIDVDFFTPLENDMHLQNNKICIFVGEHIRDFEVLYEVVRMASKEKGIYFKLVIPNIKYHPMFKVFNNVQLYINISDAGLRDLYRNSTLLVLPLRDCAACNTLLEAMACGLPVVTTDVSGVRDYIDEKGALIVPKSAPEKMFEALLYLLNTPTLLKAAGIHNRKRVLSFNWQEVALKTREVYQTVRDI